MQNPRVMLLATQLERVFILKDKGQDIRLTDPEPRWSVEAVLNFYANTYPILTTAKISAPIIRNDKIEYKLESVMGTKG
jgi:PRTRC genetic system protein C